MTIFGYAISAIWVTFLVVAWVVVACLPAMIAKSKGHNFFGWFVLSIFFWWITLFVTLFMSDRTQPSASPAPAADES